MPPQPPTRRQFLAGVAVTAAATAAGAAIGGEATAAPAGNRVGWVNRTLSRMTLEEKVGQLFVLYAYGNDATDPAAADRNANRNTYGVETPKQIIEKYAPGGLIYFGWSHNLEQPRQVATLSNGVQRASLSRPGSARTPLLVAIDQEHGVVLRLGPPVTMFPGAMGLGAGRDPDTAYGAAKITGDELRALGISQNYAPVADVNVNPLNPVIGVRSFGSEPDLVAELTAAQVRGFQRGAGVMTATKHFPGHGDTADDSHTGLPVIDHTEAEWEQIDAPPFRAAIQAGTDTIMTAHIVVPSLDPAEDPATLSRPILTGILRERLGYTGVVVTDALTMAGVRTKYGDDRVPVLALKAGADMLLMPPLPDVAFGGVMAALRSGELTEERLDVSLRRVLALKWDRGLVDDPYVNPDKIPQRIGTPEHLAAAQEAADHAVTAVKNDAGLLPLNPAGRSVLATGYHSSLFDSTGGFARELTSRGADVLKQLYGTRPTDAQIAAAVAAANERDLTVVFTHKAWDTTVVDPSGQQQKLVRQLVATGKPIIVVAVRDPYDIAYFTEASTYLAAYAYNAPVMTALAKTITGELSPSGKLPVTVPVAGDPDTVLYPYGHGLSW
ncbi:MAG: glycoside hydrolase family 3 protein [Micromonosporaceae bacterium]|nr:glycoside hydrolase family 3 protein [Micromonosporaceae bacterium]